MGMPSAFDAIKANFKAMSGSALCLSFVQQDAVNTLQEHLDNVNAQYRVGTVAKSDVLASQVQLANAQQALVTAQNNYDIATESSTGAVLFAGKYSGK